MSPKKFKDIRETLGLTQGELADVLGLSGKMPISHFETGFRQPSGLIAALMLVFESLPERKALELIEMLKHHMERRPRAQRKNKNVRKS